jgi:hypothetical protein
MITRRKDATMYPRLAALLTEIRIEELQSHAAARRRLARRRSAGRRS